MSIAEEWGPIDPKMHMMGSFMDKKIVVPEGMLKAAVAAVQDSGFDRYRVFLQAALSWLDGELEKLHTSFNQPFGSHSVAAVDKFANIRHGQLQAIKSMRSMFLVPEPSPAVLRAKRAVEGCTLTRAEADEIMQYVDECAPPR